MPKSPYLWILDYPTGVGHTSAAIESGATVVVVTQDQAKALRRKKTKALSALHPSSGERGRSDPLVFDFDTVQKIVGHYEAELLAFKSRVSSLAGEVSDLEADLAGKYA